MTKRPREGGSVERLKTLFQVPLTTQLVGSKEYYQKVLGSVCRELMVDYDMVMTDSRSNIQHRYTLLEVEVYFKTSPEYHHDDPYTHAHPLQYQNGVWYFHHVGHSKGYRGGSRKGMDVTLVGDRSDGGGGGILIRAIQCTTTNKVIEGPSLVVDLILKTLGYSSLKEMGLGDTQPCWDGALCFAPKKESSSEEEPLASYRIGLGLKNRTPTVEKRLDYVCRTYRYVMHPELLLKGKVWILMDMIQQSKAKQHKVMEGVKVKLVETCQQDMAYGRENAVDVIQACYRGGGQNDLVMGGFAWKMQLMSAILWWEDQTSNGKKVDLGI
ncbi:hypothetical protein BC941DRAFT_416589 [Chlamydoabsidia padenii]|nr:hypothetical protein BC941DRAFT_416589 [Chlamydoabsidia padenii]